MLGEVPAATVRIRSGNGGAPRSDRTDRAPTVQRMSAIKALCPRCGPIPFGRKRGRQPTRHATSKEGNAMRKVVLAMNTTLDGKWTTYSPGSTE